MTHLWTGISVAEDVAGGGSGAFNAAYFLGRSVREGGSRRTAALLLALLFAGVAADAATHLLFGEPSPASTLLRAPLAVASVIVGAVIAAGAGR